MIRRMASLGMAVLLTVAAASAQSSSYEYERPIRPAGRGGHKLAVDVPLLSGARPFGSVANDGAEPRALDGLADLRLFDPEGREVAYLLIAPPPARASWTAGAILPIAQTRRASGFEVDLGRAHVVDALAVEGLPAPFLKRLLLEGSGDRARWTLLAGQATLFDLPDDRVRQTTVEFTPGSYRYLRVTWDDTSSARMPVPSRASARAAAPRPSAPAVRADVTFERQASEPGRSRYRLRLPARGLPATAIVLDAGEGDVFRTASVLESRFIGDRADPGELGRARLMQAGRGDGASSLRIPIQPPRGDELQLVVEDASNPPLELESIAVELAALPWIYFETADTAEIVARYGNAAAASPRYDLEAKRGSVNLDLLPEASWGDPRPSTGSSERPAPALTIDRGAKIDVAEFERSRELGPGDPGLVTLQLDAAVLAHSRGPAANFADVRIVDDEGYQIPYLLERRDEPLSIELTIGQADAVDSLPASPTRNRSIHTIELPYADLPSPRLVLETPDRLFRRALQLGVERPPDRQHRDTWFEVAASTEWQHADQDRPAPPLELPVQVRGATRLLLVVDEGDNRPLRLGSARLLLPSWRVRFFRPAGRLRLAYGGSRAAPPRYDLALLAPAVLGASAQEVGVAPETATERARPAILSPRVFWIGLTLAVVVLLGLIVRLMSSGTGKGLEK